MEFQSIYFPFKTFRCLVCSIFLKLQSHVQSFKKCTHEASIIDAYPPLKMLTHP